MTQAANPIQHNFESVTSAEELKHLCPAFAQTCPFAQKDEVQSLTIMNDKLKKCPAFEQGCPFSSKTREEITSLLKTIPKDHPAVDTKGQIFRDEDAALLEPLNAFIKQNMPGLIPDEEMKPFSDALRESISKVHRTANNREFIKRLLRGEINVDEFGRYVTSLYFIYKHMEDLLEKYKEHPVVKLIHFPKELSRAEKLTQDLKQIYGPERFSQVTDDATMTPALKKYISYMYDTVEANPAYLVGHSYTRYLGDLAGGQVISQKVKKNLFGLDEKDTSCHTRYGLQFCIFENIGNHDEFKALYRSRLNSIVMTKAERETLIQGTLDTFQVNIDMLNEVQEYSTAGKLVPTVLEGLNGKNGSREENNKTSNSSSMTWLKYATVGALTLSVGVAVYKRYIQKQ